jgi:hypothetical protein
MNEVYRGESEIRGMVGCRPRWTPIGTTTLLWQALHCHMFIFERRLLVLYKLIIYTHITSLY